MIGSIKNKRALISVPELFDISSDAKEKYFEIMLG